MITPSQGYDVPLWKKFFGMKLTGKSYLISTMMLSFLFHDAVADICLSVGRWKA